jgi:hypothetical protein
MGQAVATCEDLLVRRPAWRRAAWMLCGCLFVGAIILQGGETATAAPAARGCRFPGQATTCPNSQRDWAVEWRAPSDGGMHELRLRPLRASGDAIRILAFPRYVDVLWNPNGRALAITNAAGSDSSTVLIVRTEAPDQPVDLEAELNRSLGRPAEIYQNGHRYFEAGKWESPDTLLFHVRAYDAQPGGEYKATFRFRIGGSVQKVKPTGSVRGGSRRSPWKLTFRGPGGLPTV